MQEATLRTALGAVIAASSETDLGLDACAVILDAADHTIQTTAGIERRRLAGGLDPPARGEARRIIRRICRACALCPRGEMV